MPRYCLVAKNFWLALSELAAAHELCSQEKTFFELNFLYCLVMTWKKIFTDFFAQVLNFKEFNVEKIIAVKDATYADVRRKPDKNEKFRLAARDSNPDLCDTGAVL